MKPIFVHLALTVRTPPLESAYQVVDAGEQDVGNHGPLQVTPQTLDQIQIGAVRRESIDFDPMVVDVQPVLHRSRVMIPRVVAHQTNLASRVRPNLSIPKISSGRLGKQGSRRIEGSDDSRVRVAVAIRHRN